MLLHEFATPALDRVANLFLNGCQAYTWPCRRIYPGARVVKGGEEEEEMEEVEVVMRQKAKAKAKAETKAEAGVGARAATQKMASKQEDETPRTSF